MLGSALDAYDRDNDLIVLQLVCLPIGTFGWTSFEAPWLGIARPIPYL